MKKLLITIIVLAAIAVGALVYIQNNYSVKSPVLADGKGWPFGSGAETQVSSDWKTYTNDNYGIEFKYPPNMVLGSGKFYVPGSNDVVNGATFTRELPVRYCDESGLPEHCKATTDNPRIGLYVYPKSFQDTNNHLDHSLTKLIKLAGRDGVSYEFGVEGEGFSMYIVPLSQDQTLFISRSYINENSLLAYKDVKDFLTYTEQEKLFTQILSSFEFTK